MHPDPSDSGGASLAGAPGQRRPEPRGVAAAPGAPGGGSWWVAAAALAAVCASCLLAGWWPAAAGGAGPGTVLLRLSLYLGCAAAAFLLGTVFSLVCRSPRAPPPDFAAAWRRLAARRRPEVSTGRPPAASPGPPALGGPGVAVGRSSRGSGGWAGPGRPGGEIDARVLSAPAWGGPRCTLAGDVLSCSTPSSVPASGAE